MKKEYISKIKYFYYMEIGYVKKDKLKKFLMYKHEDCELY